MKIRTRIAPSPTGEDLHIGNAYTALINYVVAAKNNGQFIIRIEDTDQTRLVKGSQEHILASLKWLGIPHEEGPDIGGPFKPYQQSQRLKVYQKYAQELIVKGHAYYCFCTQERLLEMRQRQESNHEPPMYDGLCKAISPGDAQKRIAKGEKAVIRLNVPDTGTTTFHDVIRGDIAFENKLIDDQVLIKSDGFPTYHLGVVVDDHLMEISHIIRGEEWISSTPKHILLYQFFGWKLPIFAHLSVLRNPDRSKLSKRKNPVWLSWFKKEGFLPEALRNYLGTMGWTNPSGKEIFSLKEMIESFDLGSVQTTAPVFNFEKLRWMNGEYLRSLSNSQLIKLLAVFDENIPVGSKLIDQIIPLVKDRMKTLAEFWSLAGFFFTRPKLLERSVDKKSLEVLLSILEKSEWNHLALEEGIRTKAGELDIKAKELFMDLRLAVTGKTVGPPLLESLVVLGKAETLSRLE